MGAGGGADWAAAYYSGGKVGPGSGRADGVAPRPAETGSPGSAWAYRRLLARVAELERARDFSPSSRGGASLFDAASPRLGRGLYAGAPLLSPFARCLSWAWEALGGSPLVPASTTAPADPCTPEAVAARVAMELRDLRAELREARDEAARGWEAAQRAEVGRRDALRSGAAAQAELEVALEELTETLDAAAAASAEQALMNDALEAASRRAASLWAESEAARPRLAELEGRVLQLEGAAAKVEELEGALAQEQAGAAKVREALSAAESAAADSEARVQDLQVALAASNAREQALAGQFLAERQQRRRVHDELQTFKGNIRVVARVRPSKGASAGAAAVEVVAPRRVKAEALAQGAAPGLPSPERTAFDFDAALGPGASQRDVWAEVAPLITSFCDGFNVTVLAYGQTGAGKTYTMFGEDGSPGICPRAFEAVFDRAAASGRAGQPRLITVSAVEVYLDRVHDLLSPERSAEGGAAPPRGGGHPPHSRAKKKHLPGEEGRSRPVAQQVHSLADASRLLATARAARVTAPTAVHERSSRSHAVVTVRYSSGGGPRQGVGSTLHLVDLSGSERLSKSGVVGQGLDEARSINRSLAALGDVMAALQTKRPHVPFRNCTLTRVLEGALAPAQGAKALLLCNLDPARGSLSESLGSLNFATRAARVELGRAVSAEEGGEVESRGGASTPGCRPARRGGKEARAPPPAAPSPRLPLRPVTRNLPASLPSTADAVL